MNKYIMISMTFDSLEAAEKLASGLLKDRLVSCFQMSKIKSFYHWKGKIEVDDEVLVQMKTKKELYETVEKVILKNHSYEVPQIVTYDITDGYKEYLDWIGNETK